MADKFELTDTEPAAPSGKANVKWQSDTNGNISAYVEPGASQTPWAQAINGGGFALTNAGQIEARTGGFKFPDGTTQTTAATGGGGGSGRRPAAALET